MNVAFREMALRRVRLLAERFFRGGARLLCRRGQRLDGVEHPAFQMREAGLGKGAADAAFEKRGHVQRFPDLANVVRLSTIREHRRARDHFERA